MFRSGPLHLTVFFWSTAPTPSIEEQFINLPASVTVARRQLTFDDQPPPTPASATSMSVLEQVEAAFAGPQESLGTQGERRRLQILNKPDTLLVFDHIMMTR